MTTHNEYNDYLNIALLIGTDECARGTLIGRVYAAAVIFSKDYINENIKDSKKISRKKRKILKEIIEKDALAFGIGYVDSEEIDQINILNASLKAMHIAINNLLIKVKGKNLINLTEDQIKNNDIPIRILADGNRFNQYICRDYGFIPHTCVIKGDNKYISIAAASILAKEYHDEYIIDLCKNEPDLEKYGLLSHYGYGTKKHYEALQKYGATRHHRLSFNLHLGD